MDGAIKAPLAPTAVGIQDYKRPESSSRPIVGCHNHTQSGMVLCTPLDRRLQGMPAAPPSWLLQLPAAAAPVRDAWPAAVHPSWPPPPAQHPHSAVGRQRPAHSQTQLVLGRHLSCVWLLIKITCISCSLSLFVSCAWWAADVLVQLIRQCAALTATTGHGSSSLLELRMQRCKSYEALAS